ncbi:MAG TPA: undecaprenyl-diphosphate phosphatase [Firmicutes bacterium]|nr:undecaprenyl-diphosphate phosphatase [Bacillota bacterium]
MLIIIAVILGIVQGLTEFLPVSSSGHLAAIQNLFFKNLDFFQRYDIAFDIALHFATLIVICIFFRKRILILLKSLGALFSNEKTAEEEKGLSLLGYILIGSIPTALIGFGLKHCIGSFMENTMYIGISLILTGVLMLIPDFRSGTKPGSGIGLSNALIIGLVQGIAVIPGISRSGSTISAGLLAGVEKETAFEFSFLLSIPAIAGATLVSVFDIDFSLLTDLDISVFFTGIVTGIIFGYIGVTLLAKVVRERRLSLFSYYCFGLGIILIILNLIK